MRIRGRSRALPIWLAASALIAPSCSPESTYGDQAGLTNDERGQEVRRLALMRESLISEGQGCEGEILAGERLKNLIIGKTHTYVFPGFKGAGLTPDSATRFSYSSSGKLYYNASLPDYIATFAVHPSEYCHVGQYQICFRLIKGSDKKIYTEYINYSSLDETAVRPAKLQCTELAIKDFGGDK
jgi:hypothetical protein